MSTNPYEWHDNAMAGNRGPVHEGDPQTGWYRNRRLTSAKGVTPKAFVWDAVAYWKDTKTNEQRCHVNGKQPDPLRAMEIWVFCNRYPISEEVYDQFMRTGKWPEHNEVLADQERRSNEAPDDDSPGGVAARIDALAAEASKLLKQGAAKTQAEADAAADIAGKLSQLYTHADNLRKKDKEPSLEEGRRIDALWNPIRDRALVYKDIKPKVVNPFLTAEQARLDAIARAAEQERLAKIAEAEAAAKPGQMLSDEPVYVAPVVPQKASAGSVGSRRIHQQIVKTMRIDDFDKALVHFKEHPKVRELIQELANAQARIDMPVPGCVQLKDGKAV